MRSGPNPTAAKSRRRRRQRTDAASPRQSKSIRRVFHDERAALSAPRGPPGTARLLGVQRDEPFVRHERLRERAILVPRANQERKVLPTSDWRPAARRFGRAAQRSFFRQFELLGVADVAPRRDRLRSSPMTSRSVPHAPFETYRTSCASHAARTRGPISRRRLGGRRGKR